MCATGKRGCPGSWAEAGKDQVISQLGLHKKHDSWVCSAAVLCHWRTGGERGWESPPGDGPQATDRFHIELEGFWQCSGKRINTNRTARSHHCRGGVLLLTGLLHLWHEVCGSRPNEMRSEGKHSSARRNGRVPDPLFMISTHASARVG